MGMIKKFHNIARSIDLTKKQLEKIADQLRLLSWALGAILTSSSGYNLKLNFMVSILIFMLWLFLQLVAIVVDKRSEIK
jgi:hypothetical protein